MTIEIWKPLMMASTGVRKVSIAIHKIMQEGDVVKVQFTYRRKDKTLLHPYPFLISKVKALTFPKTTIRGVTCVTIPLHEFKEDIPAQEPPIIIQSKPQGKIPNKPCWACKGTKFWLTPFHVYRCCTCYPNPNPEFKAEILDLEKVKMK
jgi:hypothetical protein